jgi:hypothetical protein
VDKRVSYYLAPRHDDFSEVPKDVCRSGSCEILYAVPANDNLAGKAIRSFNWLNLMRRLIAIYRSALHRSILRFGSTVTHM